MVDVLNDKRLADLTTVIDISRQLGATIELDPLLKSIEQAAIKVLDCERVSVFLYDRLTEELYSKVATGVEAIRFPATLGIAGEAAQTRRPIHVPDAYADERFNPAVDRATGYRTRNMLSIAMVGFDGQLMGVLQVLNKRNGGFTDDDERLAETLSALAGVAIQRQLLLEEYAQKQKLERDLDLARQIQRDYLPQVSPKIPGFDISGWNRPADQTGGDAFDFIHIEPGKLGLLIADATGHGVGPALVVAECRALIRVLASTTDDVIQIMTLSNAVLVHDLQEGRFVTAFFGFLNAADATIRYVSAGHAPLIHYMAATDRFSEIPATTLPMGILNDFPCRNPKPVFLAPGDIFILLTDGFFEWARPDGEQFGIKRVFQVVREHRDRPCVELIRILHESVVRFSEGTPQLDDLTVIMVKRC